MFSGLITGYDRAFRCSVMLRGSHLPAEGDGRSKSINGNSLNYEKFNVLYLNGFFILENLVESLNFRLLVIPFINIIPLTSENHKYL